MLGPRRSELPPQLGHDPLHAGLPHRRRGRALLFHLDGLIAAVVLYVLAINVGIGMCYHRLLTHRGYKVPKWLEYAMTVCATLSLEGGPIFWVATHRVHHQLSDHEGDPHTPHDGGWWAHVGLDPEGRRAAPRNRAARPLRAGPRERSRPPLAQQATTGFRWSSLAWRCWRIGGWPCVLWGIFLRVTHRPALPPGW